MNSIDFSKLDLAFILDTTASMGSYINHAKQNITDICDEIVGSEKCNLRVGLVNYRDHPPQEATYITQVNDFTDDILKMKNILTATTAQGGGDCPESICCGLNDCLEKLNWRCDAVKVAILIADAPPHGLGCSGDSMAEGCPLKNDPVEIAHKMAKKGITLYCAGCEPALNSYRQFFIALCLITGGQYVSLQNATHLSNVIVGGTREEISMEKMMAKVHNDLMREAAEKGKRIDEEELTKRVHEIINSKKSFDTINKLKTDIEITQDIKEFSKMNNLEEMKLFAQKNNITLIKDTVFNSSWPILTPFPIRKRGIKKPSTRPKRIINRKPKVSGAKLAKRDLKKVSSLATGVRLRRSKRIKEIEERKKKTMQIEKNTKKVVIKKDSYKRKIKNNDCELPIGSDSRLDITSDNEKNSDTKENNNNNTNKKLRKKSSSSTDLVTESINEDECDELIDMDRARRMAKKVIARNFK